MDTTEQQLIHACKSGTAEAFGALYDAYVRRIYTYIYYRTHHKETAEDLTSTCFMKALERIHSFDPAKGSFSAWIYRIAHNAVIDHYRSIKPSADIEDVWDALKSNANTHRDLVVKEQLKEVGAYLEKLTAAQRDIVIMRLWDELSYKEIAEITGKSEAACKMTFSRVMSALRIELPLAIIAILLSKPLL